MSATSHVEAARDLNSGPRHVRAAVRREKERGVGDVLGLAHAGHGHRRDDPLKHLFRHRRRHGRGDKPGQHHVAAHGVARELLGRGLGEPNHARFGGGVVRLPQVAVLADHGRNVDNRRARRAGALAQARGDPLPAGAKGKRSPSASLSLVYCCSWWRG